MARLTRHHFSTLLFLALGCLTAIALAMLANYSLQAALDRYTLSHADPAMVKLAMQAGMNRTGELVFLRAHPQLVSDAQMQQDCSANTVANNNDGFIEQGCYITSSHRIYLRRMPVNLYKLEISTAAYEMLHPVYIALRTAGKGSTVDKAIETNYAALKDANLTAQVSNFAKTEPGARDLELFSLLGTGYPSISSDLMQYYIPYFTNLGATVTATTQVKHLFQQYQAQLAQLKAQASALDAQARDAYGASVVRAHAGDQTGDDYYYGVYQQYLGQENAIINMYNGVLESYNALVTEYNGTQPVKQIRPAQAQSQ